MPGPPDLVAHVHALLSAALPGVEILRPEQQREPALAGPRDQQGRPVVNDQPRGLGAYLAQHPGGYVQIEDPTPASSSGPLDEYWTPVGVTAVTREAAHDLAERVRLALTGTPAADPGFFKRQSPPSTLPLMPGAVLVRAVYTRTLLLGFVPT